jgi:hypothetical protein
MRRGGASSAAVNASQLLASRVKTRRSAGRSQPRRCRARRTHLPTCVRRSPRPAMSAWHRESTEDRAFLSCWCVEPFSLRTRKIPRLRQNELRQPFRAWDGVGVGSSCHFTVMARRQLASHLSTPANARRAKWCGRSESNRHSFRGNGILSPARLPVPPRPPGTLLIYRQGGASKGCRRRIVASLKAVGGFFAGVTARQPPY